jgi:hypothetical protein
MDWGAEAKKLNYNFQPTRTTRKAQLSFLEKFTDMQDSKPHQVICKLSGTDELEVPVTRFDFKAGLLSLLTDPAIVSDLNNLDVNHDDPFKPFVAPDNRLGCVNSGQWYHDACNNCLQTEQDFLVPIVMACDETQVSDVAGIRAWPILFSTSILHQSLRNTPKAWKLLGYIYDLSNYESDAEHSRRGTHMNATRLHELIRTILGTYVDAQTNTTLNNIQLTFGDHTKTVNIKVPLCFIIGDMQGGDKLCSCAPVYFNFLSRFLLPSLSC